SEKQLLAGQAVIRGQEEERGRLAKDLHDGLGGMLSGIKFSLANMKSNVILDAESALVFERSLDMLDHSISELRRVAHNMMPEVLVKFGLEEAVKSYCDSVQQSGMVRVNFQSVGTAYRFASDREITVYRIIQELMTNVVKHAKANHALVQLGWQQNSVHVTVEDDGVGFDVDTLEKSRGAGWANIRSRVDFLKGKLDVQSAPGSATSVNITLPTA
ncbi:MAG: sensor histidine kinase, partial [Cyclobacteriaceae bacterium]|nr:sensor histidine kinase [Cyclobacteriaceae bacterium]